MAKDLPVTLDGKVIYHIKLTDSFQGLAEELKQLGYQADQKICIISDSNVAKLYAETVKNILTKSFPQIFCFSILYQQPDLFRLFSDCFCMRHSFK